MGSAFVVTAIYRGILDCSSATDKVHDDRDQRKDKQQVNEEAADVQNEEPTQPKQNQYNRQNEKHSYLLS
jgi:hypothetical protein